ncbi:DUF2637 domain-containing protein [Kitasatospora sp. NRRL B-11411]|uniref:DUF2637 domain-containing protein n=1 Tax=Kitasatospora sp. NRRL B-11411 TaxID=1463822 RepID=UPI00069027D3|nr:DUF2637 domain-containing protein [Kitasatospora sp. NRRL B-11411]
MSKSGNMPNSMSPWDKTAIGVMGAVGGTLSYDALQQMAVAMHVRPELSYLFPVAIDGFIAYGVRALVVLKEAPLRARAYTWTLFGASTATSVWANWTHAVRLNETTTGQGFHLTNTAVGALSTIAPLVLGGATHLYIVMSRHTSSAAHASEPAGAETEGRGAAATGQSDRDEPTTARSWWRSRLRRTRPEAEELDHAPALTEQPHLRLISSPSGPVPASGSSGPLPRRVRPVRLPRRVRPVRLPRRARPVRSPRRVRPVRLRRPDGRG